MKHKIGTRERILFAAQRVIQNKGLAKATVREIAAAADLSEGALYKHFQGKSEIFLSMLRHSPTDYIQFMAGLPARAGRATLESNLAEFGRRSMEFHALTLPIAVSLFAEPVLLAEYQQVMREGGGGPHKAVELLTGYLDAEQRLGRVGPEARTAAVASMLAGACFNQSFIDQFEGHDVSKSRAEQFVDDLIAATVRTLA